MRRLSKAAARPRRGLAELLCGAALAGGLLGAPAAAQNGPWGTGDNPAAQQHDVAYANYRFRDGEVLPTLRVHYATLGTPRRDARGRIVNAVLVLHWTGSDSRAVTTQAYMKALYGPGRPLDARRYFLIFPDSIGCGRTSKPSDGLRARFPRYGYNDMVDIQHRVVAQTLGIGRLHAILGLSMGGMNAWQWAEAYPEGMDGVMPVVSLPVRVSGRNLIWRRLVIEMIRDDPAWQGGNYQAPPPGWTHGYQLLRMMLDGVPHLQATTPDGAAADAFLADAARQSRAADPNDLLYSLQSSADYDPQPRLPAIRAKLFALNFDDDEFNPDQLKLLERFTPTVPGARYVVQRGTPTSFGHLTMAHPELWARHVATFMRELGDAPSGGEGETR